MVEVGGQGATIMGPEKEVSSVWATIPDYAKVAPHDSWD